jgi:L-lactate dehydrogenase complex protein LldG
MVNAKTRSRSRPRNLNLITGAGGTTGIGGSYVRGAHGPRHLHIVLAEG